ncbi:MAG: C4-type zinc ribbon domain-containing protein [Nitrospirota bacterium]|nr:C4-type zinc ribbon domain-containing protein [Nitrospirota bacterium]
MDDQLRLLLDLQEVDEAVFEARRKHKILPEKVAAEHAAMTEAGENLQTCEAALKAQEAAKRDREAQLEDHEAHLKRLKERVREIHNTREYQAHIQEMDGVQRAISGVEDELLQILGSIETLQGELVGLRATFAERDEVYRNERAKVDEELAVVDSEVAQLQSQRGERTARVDKPLLQRYERISQGVRRAVVPVRGYTCDGCNMNVPPQLVSEVRRGDQIHQCPHCRRILFVAEQPAPTG